MGPALSPLGAQSQSKDWSSFCCCLEPTLVCAVSTQGVIASAPALNSPLSCPPYTSPITGRWRREEWGVWGTQALQS